MKKYLKLNIRTMKTALIIGAGIIVGAAIVVYTHLTRATQQTSRFSFLKNFFKNGAKIETREIDIISMRTFGSWIKEHDFPSFSGYKFFIVKDHDLLTQGENTPYMQAYGFCVTDANFNVLDACIYFSKEVEPAFAAKVIEDVNEIVIK